MSPDHSECLFYSGLIDLVVIIIFHSIITYYYVQSTDFILHSNVVEAIIMIFGQPALLRRHCVRKLIDKVTNKKSELTFGSSIDRYSLSILPTPHERGPRISVGLAREGDILVFPHCNVALSRQRVQYVRRNCKVQRSLNTSNGVHMWHVALFKVLHIFQTYTCI